MSNSDQPPGPNETIMRPGWVNPSGRPLQPKSTTASVPNETGQGAVESASGPSRPAYPGSGNAASIETAKLDFESLKGSFEGIGPMLGFLLFSSRLRSSAAVVDPEALRLTVEAALRKASLELPKLGWDPRYVDLARYFVCCAIDEAAQNTPWGRAWAAKPLTATMSKNAVGGEKFFSQVDVMLRQPAAFEVRLFEVAYACLLSGFKGQFALQAGGEQQLEVYRESLFDAIKQKDPSAGSRLFELAIPANRPPPSVAKILPVWIPIAVGLAVLTTAFIGYRWMLGSRTSDTMDAIAQLAEVKVSLPPIPVAARRAAVDPSLLERIRRAAQSAGWTVDEASGLIAVSVSGGNSFPSGSDQLDAEASAPLQEIGDAMSGLNARVSVRGHSDAQPIRTFRFQNNAELSRARAASVGAVIAQTMQREPTLEGVGERAPLCNEQTPQCFSRNRRVEVIARYEGAINAN